MGDVGFGPLSEFRPSYRNHANKSAFHRMVYFPNPPLVMVVDDDAIARMGATDMFRHAGYEVIEAGSSSEALESFRANVNIRLLFTDISMPGAMDGADLAVEVAAHWPLVGVIATSGLPRPDKLPERMCFHDKPYAPSAVLRQVEAMTAFRREPR
jgi:CheY-like chemotaxis protein